MRKPEDVQAHSVAAFAEHAPGITEAVLETITDSVLLLGSDLRVKFANPAFFATFRVSPPEILGTLVYEPGEGQWALPDAREVLDYVRSSGRGIEHVELPCTLPDGAHRRLRVNARRIAHHDPDDALIVVAVDEVNGDTRALDELHACQERYRTLVDTAQDGIWTIDPSGNTTFANQSMAAMLGTTVEDMLGKPSFAYVFEEDVPRASELFRMKVEGDREPFEIRLRRKDGSWFWASVTGTPFHNTRGETTGLLGTFRDITERRLAEEAVARHADELARTTAALEHFSHITSHDLREPLRSMRSYAQLMIRRYGGKLDSDANDFLGFIATAAERMDKLVQDLVAYSQATERDGSITADVDLAKTLEWARKNLATRIADTSAAIEHANLPVVCGDELQLVQLFQNLLSNAIKYRRPDEPPRVQISAELRDGEWVVAVRDNGIGIPRDKFEHIFGIFKRLHGPEIPGTGIGLSICRRIAQNHGGKIWVTSEPGEGSTFFFTMPAVAHEACVQT